MRLNKTELKLSKNKIDLITKMIIYYRVTSKKNYSNILTFCKQPKNISQIKKHIGMSYESTWRRVNELEQTGLIQTKFKNDNKNSIYCKTNITLKEIESKLNDIEKLVLTNNKNSKKFLKQ